MIGGCPSATEHANYLDPDTGVFISIADRRDADTPDITEDSIRQANGGNHSHPFGDVAGIIGHAGRLRIDVFGGAA